MSTTTTNDVSRPWQAAVQASLTRADLDVIETVEYTNGLFTHHNQVVGGPSSHAIIDLDDQARSQLLAQLQAELTTPPDGTDLDALKVFVDLLEVSLQPPPSHRFDAAQFGAITSDEATGTLFGHLNLGLDVAATVHDHHHHLSFEQHPVVLPPGPYHPLSPADRASLAAALAANPPADTHWQQILTDAQA